MKELILILNKKLFEHHMYKELSKKILDNFPQFIDYFNLSFYEDHRSYISNCYIHNGDNPSALIIYKNNPVCPGYWKCFTHQCQEKFPKNAFGFIWALLSKDGEISEQQVKKTILSILGESDQNFYIGPSQLEKEKFVNITNHFHQDVYMSTNKTDILNSLEIPSKYYINRGYSAEILTKYKIGDCYTNEHMRNRAVIPVFDDSGQTVVGYSGRSISPKCSICRLYHPTSSICPPPSLKKSYHKWKHSFGFKSHNYLYNLWEEKDYIWTNKTVILVESPGNALRLAEAGVQGSLALMGTNLSLNQKAILDQSGAFNAILIMDNDENGVGEKAAYRIMNQLANEYRVTFITPSKNDLGDMTKIEILEEIVPQIDNFVDRCMV